MCVSSFSNEATYCPILRSHSRSRNKTANLSLFDDIVLDTPKPHQGRLATLLLVDSVQPLAPPHLALQHWLIAYFRSCCINLRIHLFAITFENRDTSCYDATSAVVV